MRTQANAYSRQNLIFSPISSAIANWFIYSNHWYCDIVVDSNPPFLLATREHTNFQVLVLGLKLTDPQPFSFRAETFLFDFFDFLYIATQCTIKTLTQLPNSAKMHCFHLPPYIYLTTIIIQEVNETTSIFAFHLLGSTNRWNLRNYF